MSRGGRWRAGAGAALVAVAGAAGCGAGGRDFPPGPQVVEVSMTEYRFAFDRPARAGRIVVDARNHGRRDHELVLISVPDGLPPIVRQLRSKRRVVVPTVARMARRGPGRRGTFAVDLTPGRYALVCFVDDGAGQHAQKGMAAEFTLRR